MVSIGMVYYPFTNGTSATPLLDMNFYRSDRYDTAEMVLLSMDKQTLPDSAVFMYRSFRMLRRLNIE